MQKFSLAQAADNIQTNFWLYPVVMSLTCVVLLFIGLAIDFSLPQIFLLDEYLVFNIDEERAIEILSIIATTTITITSVTMSLTIVTLSLATNQLGSRLLYTFLRRGRTQFIIGLLFGCYIYSMGLIVLASSAYFSKYPIFISLYIALLLAIMSFFALVYFIHYVCNSIQVTYALHLLYLDTKGCIKRIVEDSPKTVEPENNGAIIDSDQYQLVRVEKRGYIQALDYTVLSKSARDEKTIIELLVRPGHYLHHGMPIAKVYGCTDVDLQPLADNISSHITTGRHRTIIQDIEFGFEQISEIAVRALSPGINAPYNAIQCVNIIGDLLHELSKFSLPSKYLAQDDKVVLICRPFSYTSIVDAALNQIRQNSLGHVSVILAIMTMVKQTLSQPVPTEISTALKSQVRMLDEAAKQQAHHQEDRAKIANLYQSIVD